MGLGMRARKLSWRTSCTSAHNSFTMENNNNSGAAAPAFQALVTMATRLTKGLASLIAHSLTLILHSPLDQQRFDSVLERMATFKSMGKPDLFAVGYVLQSDLSLASEVDVFSNPTALVAAKRGGQIVMCLLIVGKQGHCLTEPDVDTAEPFNTDGRLVVRSFDQLLPLLAFPIQESETMSPLKKRVEDMLSRRRRRRSHGALQQAPRQWILHEWDKKLSNNSQDSFATSCFENRRFSIIVALLMAQHPHLHDSKERIEAAKAIIFLLVRANDQEPDLSITMWQEIIDSADISASLFSMMQSSSLDVVGLYPGQSALMDDSKFLTSVVNAFLPTAHSFSMVDDSSSQDLFDTDEVEGRQSPVTLAEERAEAVLSAGCIDVESNVTQHE